VRQVLRACLLLILLANVACDGDEDRFERIAKLRGLGLSTSPVIASPSSDTAPSLVEFTFYAAAPLGETVTAAPYQDLQGSLRKFAIENFTVGDVTYEDHSSLRVVKVKATGVVPPASAIYFDPDNGFATVRYAISLVGQSNTQVMVGNLVVYPTGSTELTSKNNLPTVSITNPTKDGTVSATEQEIKAELTEVNDETYRVGWFVSGGRLEARNKVNTTWKPTGSGKYTVIVTARGTKTSAFGIDVVDVTAN
jgi:membrane carboxypeptidase/penicillin-binding protein PbpC